MTLVLPTRAAIADHIFGRYELCIIDQWGVLHNGATPFPHARDTIQQLHKHGAYIVILSNSGRLAKYSESLIFSMGFDRVAIKQVITSGQAARQWISEKKHPLSRKLGQRFLYWGFDNDHSALDGLGLSAVDNVKNADFIVAAGAMRARLELYEDELQAGAKMGIPMLCTNPDMVSQEPDGSLKMCPGIMAARYEELGGQVLRFGKPAKEVYEMAIAHHPTDKILGIGDSLEHDIQGAQGINADSWLITNGIHRPELPNDYKAGDIQQLAQKYGAKPPTFASAYF